MAAKMSVLGLILSSYPYLRSAMVRFPFNPNEHKIMLLILGSIDETSLNNMYVRKPIKEEYTFETEIYKATS